MLCIPSSPVGLVAIVNLEVNNTYILGTVNVPILQGCWWSYLNLGVMVLVLEKCNAQPASQPTMRTLPQQRNTQLVRVQSPMWILTVLLTPVYNPSNTNEVEI